MADIVDINVNKTVETIDINATPNVVQININSISGDVEWGEIDGTLSNQTDLQNALDLKANTSDLGAVAFSNDYNDLGNLPTIPNNLEELHNVTETNYTTPIDTDSLLTFDVTNSLWKRLSWANVKSNLKTYFDTIYQTALGFTPENVANKTTNLTSPDNIKYPTTLAVSTALNGKQDTLTNPITGTGANGQVAFFNGTTTQTSDNVFVWDNTNKRLGIGTNTPSTSLDVLGALTLRKTSENEQTILTINRFNSIPMFKLHISGVGDNQLFLRNDYNQNIITFERSGGVIVQGSLYSNTELGIGRSIGNYLSKFLSTDADGSFYELQTDIEGVGWGSLLQWNRSRTYFNILSNNVGIGTTSPQARLDVKAQGALSTDIVFRVRNSADTDNLIAIDGAGGVEINSTTRGFLPPRMTTAQRNAIATPAAGLVVYDTTDNKHYGYNGTSWYTMDADIVTTNRQSASYTLTLTDRNKLVEMDVATANNLTIPLNSSVAFPIGTKIDVVQYGAGQTTFVPVSGVTIRSANNWLKMNARYGAATLTKIGTDEWYLWGNLNA